MLVGSERHRRVLKWSAVGLASLLLVTTLAVGGGAWYAADHLLHPAREPQTRTPESVGLEFQRVAFPSRDGVPLVGWWIPAAGAVAGTVVFLHGYGASKQQALPAAPFLHDAGYNVLAFDFRAHGESGGSTSTLGVDEVRDVQGAVDWLGTQKGVGPIALLGWSMGAATAINAAPELPQVRAIVADSGFASLAAVAGRAVQTFSHLPPQMSGATVMLGSWLTGHPAADDAPERAIAKAHQPLLLIAGGADSLVPPENSRELQTAAGSRAQLWLVPGAAHVAALDIERAQYEAHVLGFLRANLGAA